MELIQVTPQALAPYWGTTWPAGERRAEDTKRDPELYQERLDGWSPKAQISMGPKPAVEISQDGGNCIFQNSLPLDGCCGWKGHFDKASEIGETH